MFERGELLLVAFPFSDLSATKRRPVLALTTADRYGDFVGLPVTSRPHHTNAVPISSTDLTAGSLPLVSWVRTDRVVTLNSGLVVKSIGRVAGPVVHTAVRRLCDFLSRS
jgi:mRNA interferase MazF